jgi:hypothetical protein
MCSFSVKGESFSRASEASRMMKTIKEAARR